MFFAGEDSGICEENFERAASAVKRDDVDALKDVLEVLPEFNTMCTQYGSNLLHLSCLSRNKKAFDYLLNLNCFDLEAVDNDGYSTLVRAMNHDCDYFSMKLINTGVDVFKICPNEKTYLHHAMGYTLFETAELLLQKGVDPNAQDYRGRTALHTILVCHSNSKVDEGVSLLLEYGADTSIFDNSGDLPFDYAFVHKRRKLSIQEHLFYCTFDSHSADYTMQSGVLATLLDAPRFKNVSPLFDNVMDVASEVNLEGYFNVNFFAMPLDLLKKFIERYGYFIRRVFSIIKPDRIKEININNIEILLNSELHFETVELISRLDLWRIFSHYYSKECKEEVSSLILYLLSYGLNVTSSDCQKIYRYKGYSDLFKTMLLHLNYTDTSQIRSPMVKIIVDIHCDLNTMRFNRFSFDGIESLLDYFANPGLRLFCKRTYEPNLINKVRQLPTVPSLLQLARDETKRHIVRRYNLQKTSQYYWVLRRLLGDTNYAEILSFESKLYG